MKIHRKRLLKGRELVFFLGLVFSLWSASAVAIEMEDLMDDVLEDVRHETRQTIQQQVKTETREVIAEEQVIPSNSISGSYTGDVTFGPGDVVHTTCTLTVQTGTGSIPFSATCVDTENHTFSLTGTIINSTFTFSITETTAVCAGHRTSSGSGTVSGQGEPGTTLSGSYGGTCGDSTGSFNLTKL